MATQHEPATLLSRWTSVPAQNPQSSMALIIRKLNNPSTARRAVQIRPFRLPGANKGNRAQGAQEGKKDTGRNLFVVRVLATTSEQMMVFVEDPSAGMRLEKNADRKPEAVAQEQRDGVAHTRWTYCTVGGATQASPLATPFDAFLQRVLLGGGPSPGLSNGGAWVPRSAAISIEGFIVSSGDWEVKVGTVMVKGGAAAGTAKGLLVEATYLPVPYLPAGSTFIKDFISTLFPPHALTNNEVEWVEAPEEDFYEAGLNERASDSENSEWEWAEKHSALTYVKLFKREGLL